MTRGEAAAAMLAAMCVASCVGAGLGSIAARAVGDPRPAIREPLSFPWPDTLTPEWRRCVVRGKLDHGAPFSQRLRAYRKGQCKNQGRLR